MKKKSLKVIEKSVECSFTQVGFHHWPEAPDVVDFLRMDHRHVFHITVSVKVTDSNREVEFFTLKDAAEGEFRDMQDPSDGDFPKPYYGERSCEMLAEELGRQLADKYNVSVVSVSEDDENGATVYFDCEFK